MVAHTLRPKLRAKGLRMIWAEGVTIQARTISVDSYGQAMSAESGATDLDGLLVNRFRLLMAPSISVDSGQSKSVDPDALRLQPLRTIQFD